MTLTITIRTDAPAAPGTVREYGDALAEVARALNHVTRHHESLPFPADVDGLIRDVALAASRLPQLCTQAGRRAEAWHASGVLEVAGGRFEGHEGAAVASAVVSLRNAAAFFEAAAEALGKAAEVTSHLAVKDSSEEGEGDGRGPAG